MEVDLKLYTKEIEGEEGLIAKTCTLTKEDGKFYFEFPEHDLFIKIEDLTMAIEYAEERDKYVRKNKK